MPAQALKKLLEQNGVEYSVLPHDKAYTSGEIAHAAHVPGRELAKTVIVKLDGHLAMVVLPAPERVDLDLVKAATGAETAELASEEEFREHFPECETGAMPPFGNLYDMQVYVDEGLTEDTEIAFNAGTHTELFSMAYADYERLVKPGVARLSNSYTTGRVS